MVNIAYGCVTNSRERFERYVMPRVGDRPLFVLWNQTSMTWAYNRILSACVSSGVEMLILLHDDLELIDPQAESKFGAALAEQDAGIVGVAGGRNIFSLAWWNAETVGYQRIESGVLDFGPRTGDVDSLEGSIMAFGPWAIENLRFDERFTGFHGYDDIGMVARSHGKRVIVTDVETCHHTQLGFSSPESEQAWFVADERFRRKWALGD